MGKWACGAQYSDGHHGMAWLVGIDEAGYGPNLGPLVMTAVACRVADPAADLWHALRGAVRRHGERDDGRLLVADSKLVYSTARGLAWLEKAVLAALLRSAGPMLFLDLATLLNLVSRDAAAELHAEMWYSGASSLPLACDPDELAEARAQLDAACGDACVAPEFCRSVVVCAPRFNDLTDARDSKAAALGHGLSLLLRACLEETAAEPMTVVVDKHGGRNRYAGLLWEALPGAVLLPREEGTQRSVYDIAGFDRPLRVTFAPRADGDHFPVALASMVSKYLREALMGEFNAFWQGQVPGLKATAGYPGDAARFFAEIRPALEKLGVAERQVWRRR